MDSVINIKKRYTDSMAWKLCHGLDISTLLDILNCKNRTLRFAAADQLQLRGGRDVVLHAMALCKSKQFTLREIGAYILGQITIPSRKNVERIMDILSRLIYEDKSGLVRAAATYSLAKRCDYGYSNYKKIIDVLHHASVDKSASVRHAVSSAFGLVEDERCVPLAEKLLCDPDDAVRDWAAFSVQFMPLDSIEIRNALVAMLNDEYEEARCEAIRALAILGDERVLPTLQQELSVENETIRNGVDEAAADLGDASLIPLLEHWQGILKDDNAIKENLTRLRRKVARKKRVK